MEAVRGVVAAEAGALGATVAPAPSARAYEAAASTAQQAAAEITARFDPYAPLVFSVAPALPAVRGARAWPRTGIGGVNCLAWQVAVAQMAAAHDALQARTDALRARATMIQVR